MTTRRRTLYVDRSPGELRAVLALDGEPERLVVQRTDEDQRLLLGARHVARVASVEPALATAFLDLGGGAEAILSFKPDARPHIGELLEVEVRTEAKRGKLAVVRRLGAAAGPVGLLDVAADPVERFSRLAPDAVPIDGPAAREMADEAEAQALAPAHPLPGGGEISIEPTRALVAIDVDLGARKGADAKRVARQANMAALVVAARLLRLKSLGGLVVIDLVGRGHDANALITTARAAFAPDNPGVVVGPVGRFGAMELVVPRRTRPIAEVLCDETGALSRVSLAHRLIRRLQDEAIAQPGARLIACCAPEVAESAAPFAKVLAEQVGARFEIKADPAWPIDRMDIGAA